MRIKRIATLVVLAMWLVCVGCASRDARLSLDYVTERMNTLCEEKEIVSLFYDGYMGLSVNTWADEEFEATLRLSEWEPIEMESESREFRNQAFYKISLEYAGDATYSLRIGEQYGAVERLDYTEDRKQAYYGSACFRLPQNNNGEILDALYRLVEDYIAETGDKGCLM